MPIYKKRNSITKCQKIKQSQNTRKMLQDNKKKNRNSFTNTKKNREIKVQI